MNTDLDNTTNVHESQYIKNTNLVSRNLIANTTNEIRGLYTESHHDMQNKTVKPISIYEHTKLIGLRAEQLVRGAPILVPLERVNGGVFDPYKVAEAELNMGKLPFIISRTYPDSKTELVRLSQPLE